MKTKPYSPVVEQQEALMARAYVRTESGAEYKLVYYIFSSEKQEESTVSYGIMIKQYDNNTVISESILLSEDKEETMQLIDCFARNLVFPSTLLDLITDMGYIYGTLEEVVFNRLVRGKSGKVYE